MTVLRPSLRSTPGGSTPLPSSLTRSANAGRRAPPAPPSARRRPSSTCSRISDWAAVGDQRESISRPRFIGPGCITSAPRLGPGQLLRIQAEIAEIFLGRGNGEGASHPPRAGGAEHHDDVGVLQAGPSFRGKRRRPSSRCLPAAAWRADDAHPRAQRSQRQNVGARDDLECRMSPQIADRQPLDAPWRLRQIVVGRPEQRLPGRSVRTRRSPALMTSNSTLRASRWTAPACMVAHGQ